MAAIIASGLYDVVFASRILGKGALRGGMPLYKYIANRILTFIQNLLMNQKLSEYHTGYRAFSREVLLKIPFEKNSEGFVFDNEIIAQIFYAGYEIARTFGFHDIKKLKPITNYRIDMMPLIIEELTIKK
ncbi:MAG: hypothetical protein QXI89_02490 [Candidatus Anstonellales archaeon]